MAFEHIADAVCFKGDGALIDRQDGFCPVAQKACIYFRGRMAEGIIPSCRNDSPARLYAIQKRVGCPGSTAVMRNLQQLAVP